MAKGQCQMANAKWSMPMANGEWEMANGKWLCGIDLCAFVHLSLPFWHWPFAIGHLVLAISPCPSGIVHLALAICCWPFAVGHWQMPSGE